MNAMFSLLKQTVTNWFGMVFNRRRSRKITETTIVEPVADGAVNPTLTEYLSYAQKKVSVMERRRRRHDKFVKPNGELPVKPKRDPRPAQEVKPESMARPDDTTPDEPCIEEGLGYVAEPHHEDREAGDVMFKYEEALGEFNFRDTILDQLDRYFFYLKRMKKNAPDTYGFYKEIGATILPYLATGAFHRQREDRDTDRTAPLPPLPSWFHETRPTFGCYVYGADPETEKFEQGQFPDSPKSDMWVPKFMYFEKAHIASSDVQPMKGGDTYKLTFWWDRPGSKGFKHGIPQAVPIFVSEDGKTIMALKVRKTTLTPMRSSRGSSRDFCIPSRGWEIPKEYRAWAKQHEEDIQRFLASLFIETISHSVNSHMSMVRVAVTKNRITAVFSVNVHRTAYFFQDRDIQVTHGGTRKPIFHLVRPHVRKDGSAVKMHFRGAREFTWAGYQVRITIPGRDHIDINDFAAGYVDDEAIEDKKKGYVSLPKMGQLLADEIRKPSRTGVR